MSGPKQLSYSDVATDKPKDASTDKDIDGVRPTSRAVSGRGRGWDRHPPSGLHVLSSLKPKPNSF